MSQDFTAEEREAFYQVIESRRDVRAFRHDPVPDGTLQRILDAAHHAPSVGFMQPWNFIVIRDQAIKTRVQSVFAQENERAAEKFEGERGRLQVGVQHLGHVPDVLLCADPRRAGATHRAGETKLDALNLVSPVDVRIDLQHREFAAALEGVE